MSAVCLDFGPHSLVAAHVPSVSLRLLLTGLLFAGTGTLVVVSPLGRLSGGHLNPVVTLAFRITGHVHPRDLFGYIAAQCVGAVVGAAIARVVWGQIAVSVHDGATAPAASIAPLAAVGIEALMTAILIMTILFFLSRRALAPWTPLAVWILVAVLVWQGAHYTGTSLNPARSLGPALIAGSLSTYWIYVVGPLAGGIAAAVAVRTFRMRPLTAKLCHDASYPSTFACDLPVAT